MSEVVEFRRPGTVTALIASDVRIARLVNALAHEGLAVSSIPGGQLLIHDAPEYRARGETPTGEVPSFLRWQPPDLRNTEEVTK